MARFGRNKSESAVELNRKVRSDYIGINGRFGSEYAAEDTDFHALFAGPPEHGAGGSTEQGIKQGPVVVEEGPQQEGHGKSDVLPVAVGKDVALLRHPLFSDFTTLPITDGPGDGMSAFSPVELRQDPPAIILIINIMKKVQRLVDPPYLHDRLRQRRWTGTPEQGTEQFRCMDGAQLQGAGCPHHFIPVIFNLRQLHASPGQFIQCAVVGIFVDSPEYGFSGIRQPGRKLVSQQPEQAKNNIAGSCRIRGLTLSGTKTHVKIF